MDRYARERVNMVDRQIRARGITDQRVLEAMLAVPRHCFVPAPYRRAAYEDRPLPIGEGQTISQPYIVALMTSLIEPDQGDRVLEIGAGSGYQAAVLAGLAERVISVERIPSVASGARMNLERLGITNVEVVVSDGTEGWAAAAPYDGIIVTAACPAISQPLIEQLAEGGRLVAPVGGRDVQDLIRVVKRGGKPEEESFGAVCFVPLIGRHGWQE